MSREFARILKHDLLGSIALYQDENVLRIRRDTSAGHPALRWFARYLLRRERRALLYLAAHATLGDSRDERQPQQIPRLLTFDDQSLERDWLAGEPLQQVRPQDPRYFAHALRLVRQLHACGITHNDLAKEPNWLVTPEGRPALVDFQLARCTRGRGPLFRALAHTDLRHLYKHKRTYCPEALTARQRRLLAEPSPLSRLWRMLIKRPYLWVTRRLLGWADREGRYERH
jgi:hypothetical protein